MAANVTTRLQSTLFKVSYSSISLKIDSLPVNDTFTASSPVRSLGLNFYRNLVISEHVTHPSRSYFMHFRNLHKIRPLDARPQNCIHNHSDCSTIHAS